MCFSLERFAELRPYLYHLTYSANLKRIRATGRLESTNSLLAAARQRSEQSRRRPEPLPIQVDGHTVVIRDQHPLHQGNIELQDGWLFEDLVRYINGFVFFWPGDVDGPIKPGLNYFCRYSKEASVVLRVPTADVFQSNGNSVRFSKYNSGAPRCNRGLRSPRGPQTFQAADALAFRPSEVVEVAFERKVELPRTARTAPISKLTRWEPLEHKRS